MKSVTRLILCIFLFLHLVCAQFALTDIFSRYPQLSRLQALITNSTTLSNRFFSASNFTLLAPTDTAILAWLSNNVTKETVEAVLLYHLLEGRHPVASIPASSTVIKSALTNESYANVTGGQRVEVSNPGVVQFQSDAKATSKILTADIVGDPGFVHIIDKVLDIPTIFGVSASKANLSYLIDLVDRGNYLQNTTYSWDIASRRDSTYFAPNSAVALTHIPLDGTQSTYNALLEYHCIGQLVYATDLINGTELPTFNGGKVIIRVDGNGTIYANNAKVIGTDYLVFNGVMHIIDDIMDPNNNTLAPPTTSSVTSIPVSSSTVTASASPSTAAAEPSKEMSVGAKAGIGVAVAAVTAGVLSVVLLLYCQRRKKKRSLRKAKSQDNISLQDMSSPTNHNSQEPNTIESPAELLTSPPPSQQSTGSSTELSESTPPSPVEDLPMYPQQSALENQEPKSLNQVLENGGLEPKSLNSREERPRRPP